MGESADAIVTAISSGVAIMTLFPKNFAVNISRTRNFPPKKIIQISVQSNSVMR